MDSAKSNQYSLSGSALKKIAMVDSTNDQLISQWVYPNDMKIFDVLDNIKNIYLTDSMIQILIDFERVISELDVYVFEHWEQGELVDGPRTERYYVSCTFMWPLKKMPNPAGGERLIDYGIKVSYKKDKLSFPRKIVSAADFRPGTKKAKIDERVESSNLSIFNSKQALCVRRRE